MHTFPGGLKILRMCSCMPSELKLKMVSVNLVKMMSLKETKKTLTLSTENYLWASSYSYTLSDRCSSLCDVSLSLMSVPLCFTANRCTEMVNAVCLTRLLL